MDTFLLAAIAGATVAGMLDPLRIIAGLLAGLIARTILQAALFSAALAVCGSILFTVLAAQRQLQPGGVSYVALCISYAAWTFAGFGVKKAFIKSKEKEETQH